MSASWADVDEAATLGALGIWFGRIRPTEMILNASRGVVILRMTPSISWTTLMCPVALSIR